MRRVRSLLARTLAPFPNPAYASRTSESRRQLTNQRRACSVRCRGSLPAASAVGTRAACLQTCRTIRLVRRAACVPPRPSRRCCALLRSCSRPLALRTRRRPAPSKHVWLLANMTMTEGTAFVVVLLWRSWVTLRCDPRRATLSLFGHWASSVAHWLVSTAGVEASRRLRRPSSRRTTFLAHPASRKQLTRVRCFDGRICCVPAHSVGVTR